MTGSNWWLTSSENLNCFEVEALLFMKEIAVMTFLKFLKLLAIIFAP